MKFADYPLALKPSHKYWQMVVPVISTCHITKEDNDHLQEISDKFGLNLFPPSYQGSGFLLLIEEEGDFMEDEHLSQNCRNLLRLFLDKGYKYIRLSGDGDEFTDIPTFDW